MIKVMAFGSFDLFHDGHEAYLIEAKSYGDELVVVVSRDYSYERLRDQKPLFLEQERLQTVKSKIYVDKAFIGDKFDFYKVIEREKPNILVLGYDQKAHEETITGILKARGLNNIKIVRAKAHKPHIFKSSLLKNKN